MIAARYQKLAILVDALQLRERVLLLIGSIVLLFFLVDKIGFQPAIQKQQLLLQGIKDQEMYYAHNSVNFMKIPAKSSQAHWHHCIRNSAVRAKIYSYGSIECSLLIRQRASLNKS